MEPKVFIFLFFLVPFLIFSKQKRCMWLKDSQELRVENGLVLLVSLMRKLELTVQLTAIRVEVDVRIIARKKYALSF